MNRPGAGLQPLRGLSGFPGQQAQLNRNAPLGSSRLQNGKIANPSSWGFGMPNGAPGLPTPQSRATGGASSSFAQSIGGSQPATPLDLSDFPSLSGAPQAPFQNPGQAVWGNASQRATLHTPVQRPQQAHPNALNAVSSQQSTQHQQDQVQQSLDDAYFSSSQRISTIEDYQHGGQSGVGQLSGSHQPQSSSVEEFPPLGRNGPGEIGQDRRGNMVQNAATSIFAGSSTFSTDPSSIRASGNVSRLSRHGDLSLNPGIADMYGLLDTPSMIKFASSADQQRGQALSQPQAPSSRAQPLQAGFGRDLEGSPVGATSRTRTPLSEMAPIDKWGIQGLLEKSRSEDPNMSGLAIGHDLTNLGLDLNSREPLMPTWSGPFNNFPTRPLPPKFTIPPCYTVANVHPQEEKISSFSDETLFFIFYTMPRDAKQELAAIELTQRNWRYHKVLQIWLTKNDHFANPVNINQEVEHGRYIVFNYKTWQRESRDMILVYADLDTHITDRQRIAGNVGMS